MSKMEEKLAGDEIAEVEGLETEITLPKLKPATKGQVSFQPKGQNGRVSRPQQSKRPPTKQTMGKCKICGYLSSQEMCKACVLLEGLNKNRPKVSLDVTSQDQPPEKESLEDKLTRSMAHMGMG